MSTLPPVFVEFVGVTGGFKAATAEVERSIARVERTGGGTFAKVGKAAATGLTIAAVAAGGLAIKAADMAGNYQYQMNRLVHAAGELPKNLKVVHDGVLQVMSTTGTSMQEATKGIYYIESASYHGSAALTILANAAKGAKIENADLGEVANAVSSAMVDYHYKASQSAQVVNTLIAAVAHGKTTFGEMASAFVNVGAAGSAAHIPMADLAAAIATMTMHGTDAAKAGTYLRQVIGQLEAPSAKARKEMKGLGIDANQLGLTLSSGPGGLARAIGMIDDAIQKHLGPSGLVAVETFKKSKGSASDFQKLLANLPPEMQTTFGALSNMTGGVKSLQGFLQLGGANLKTFRDNTAAVNEAVRKGGNNIEGWADTQKTFNNTMDRFKESVSAAMIVLGEMFLPILTKVFGFLGSAVGPAVRNVNGWLHAHSAVISQVAHVLQTVAITAWHALVTAFHQVVSVIVSGLGPAFRAISDWMQRHRVLLMQIGTVLRESVVTAWRILIGTLRGTIAVVSDLVRWFNRNRAVAVGLGAAVGVLTAAFVAQKIAAIASSIATKAMAAAQWLLNVAMDANPILLIVSALVGLAAGLWYAYNHSKTFRNAIADVGRVGIWIWRNVLEPVVDFFKNNWKTALQVAVAVLAPFIAVPLLIVKHWNTILEFFKKLPDRILGYTRDAGRWLLRIGWDVVHGLRTGITIGARDVWSWVTFLPRELWRLLSGAGSWLLNIGRDIIGGLIRGIGEMVGSISRAFDDVWGSVESSGKQVLDGIIAVINMAIDGINSLIHGFNDATNGLSDLWTWAGVPGIPKVPDIPHIPYLASGGIVTRPTIALVGEAGPEAVVPLNRYNNGNFDKPQVIEVHSHLYVDGREMAESVEKHQLRTGMRRGQTYQSYQRGLKQS